jgi:carboxylesterase
MLGNGVPLPLPPATKDAFALTPEGAVRASALSIHGYTGTPWEVLPVSMALALIGVSSTGIVLPGHEGDHTVLHRTSWQDWQRAGEAAFDVLPRDQPRILVGSSMGALVALLIAARRPDDVQGLVLLAPALRLFLPGRFGAALAARGLWRLKAHVVKELEGGDISDDVARKMSKSYGVLPLRGVGELGLLQGVVEAELHNVRAPVCLVHGAQDHTIPPQASEIVAAKVSSARVERHVLRDSFHVVGVDVERDQVCAIATHFVSEILR